LTFVIEYDEKVCAFPTENDEKVCAFPTENDEKGCAFPTTAPVDFDITTPEGNNIPPTYRRNCMSIPDATHMFEVLYVVMHNLEELQRGARINQLHIANILHHGYIL
jgi:hypothetical protein